MMKLNNAMLNWLLRSHKRTIVKSTYCLFCLYLLSIHCFTRTSCENRVNPDSLYFNHIIADDSQKRFAFQISLTDSGYRKATLNNFFFLSQSHEICSRFSAEVEASDCQLCVRSREYSDALEILRNGDSANNISSPYQAEDSKLFVTMSIWEYLMQNRKDTVVPRTTTSSSLFAVPTLQTPTKSKSICIFAQGHMPLYSLERLIILTGYSKMVIFSYYMLFIDVHRIIKEQKIFEEKYKTKMRFISNIVDPQTFVLHQDISCEIFFFLDIPTSYEESVLESYSKTTRLLMDYPSLLLRETRGNSQNYNESKAFTNNTEQSYKVQFDASAWINYGFLRPTKHTVSHTCGNPTLRMLESYLNHPLEVKVGRVFPVAYPQSNYNIPTHHKLDSQKLCRMVFITFDTVFHTENALALQSVLLQLGFLHVEVMGLFNYTRYLQYEQGLPMIYNQPECQNFPFRLFRAVQIAIAPHRPTMLSDYYIAFHTENTWDSYFSDNLTDFRYGGVLQNAKAVLAYSKHNNKFLCSLMTNNQMCRIFLIPIYSKALYFQTEKTGNELRFRSLYPMKGKDNHSRMTNPVAYLPNKLFDILCFGSPSDRRNQMLSKMQMWFAEDRISIVPTQFTSNVNLLESFSKEFLIVHGKVFLNIHQFEDSILETHRINHLLSLGMVVISERSIVDPGLDEDYSDAVIFENDLESMYKTALLIIRNESLWQDAALKSFTKYESIMKSTKVLEEALVSVMLD